MRKFQWFAVTPFLLTAYFILFYYSHNIFKVEAGDLPAVLIILLLSTGVALALGVVILRNLQQAVLVTALVVILFFSYGRVATLIQSYRFLPFYRPIYLKILWSLLMLGGLVFALRKPRRLPPLNRFMGIMSVILVAIALSTIVYNLLTFRTPDVASFIPKFEVEASGPVRDIYYIILDEYVGNRTLLNALGYDNSQFADSLRDRGFYFAEDAHSNYFMTILSLPSSLNMMYLDFLDGYPGDILTSNIWLAHNNVVMQTLKQQGYTYVHFGSGNVISRRSPHADIVYEAAGQAQFFDRIPLFSINGFNQGLMDTTALGPFLNSDDHPVRTRHYLERLPEIPKMAEPTFTFVHLMIPHKPWVFTADDGPENPNGRVVDGEIVDVEKYALASGYIDQIMFTNRVISELVDTILAESEVEPIIIIQGDHGFRQLCDDCRAERSTWDDEYYADMVLPIFSAYYLPDGGDEILYPAISPVNSFRVIFNYYFGANLELLDDRHYRPIDYITRANEFIEITDVVEAGTRPDS